MIERDLAPDHQAQRIGPLFDERTTNARAADDHPVDAFGRIAQRGQVRSQGTLARRTFGMPSRIELHAQVTIIMTIKATPTPMTMPIEIARIQVLWFAAVVASRRGSST